jgi:hypothetical protein
MDKADSTRPWYAPWRESRGAECGSAENPAEDPAGYGTAFGLDLSFDEPAPAAGLTTEPAAPPSLAQRLVQGRRSAS